MNSASDSEKLVNVLQVKISQPLFVLYYFQKPGKYTFSVYLSLLIGNWDPAGHTVVIIYQIIH